MMDKAIEILKREAIERLQWAEETSDADTRRLYAEQGSAIMYSIGILRDAMEND